MGGPSREVMSTPKPLPSEVGTKKLWWRFGRTRRTSRRVPEFTMVDKTRSQLSEKSAPASAVVFDVPRSCKLSLLLVSCFFNPSLDLRPKAVRSALDLIAMFVSG